MIRYLLPARALIISPNDFAPADSDEYLSFPQIRIGNIKAIATTDRQIDKSLHPIPEYRPSMASVAITAAAVPETLPIERIEFLSPTSSVMDVDSA